MNAEPTASSQLALFAAYHGWANAVLLSHVGKVSDEQYRAPAGLFFESIHGTLNHLLVGDRSWYGRFIGKPESYTNLAMELEADRDALANRLLERHLLWQELIGNTPAATVSGDLHYRTTAGATVTTPWMGTLMHVFNHATHHRGQITAALTGMGYASPELDMIFYLRQAHTPIAGPIKS
ncbi:DinB family protein [Alcaligenaceae bacterium]|nr:DinB family protein [Alcaligenaceae bacterium]